MAKKFDWLEVLISLGVNITNEVRTVAEQISENSSVNDAIRLGAILFTLDSDVRATNGTTFKWKHVLAVFPYSTVIRDEGEIFLVIDFSFWQQGQSNYNPKATCAIGHMKAVDLYGAKVVEDVVALPENYRERWEPVVDLMRSF